MVNWNNIHKDFENNPQLISEWEELGFSYSECKEWIEEGLEPQDAGYAFWMKEASNNHNSKINQADTTKEILLLKISEINELKEEKNLGMVVQSLTKLLRSRNKLIEQLKKNNHVFRSQPQTIYENQKEFNFSNWNLEDKRKEFNQIVINEETLRKLENWREMREKQQKKFGSGYKLNETEERENEKVIQLQTKICLLEEEKQKFQEELTNQQEYYQLCLQELKKFCQENEELRKVVSSSLKKNSSSSSGSSEMVEVLQRENKILREKLSFIKQKELEQLKNYLKTKLEESDLDNLDDLLEAQLEFSQSNDLYAEKQLEKSKKRLLREEKLTERELISICEVQDELAKLEIGTETKLEAKIEIPPK